MDVPVSIFEAHVVGRLSFVQMLSLRAIVRPRGEAVSFRGMVGSGECEMNAFSGSTGIVCKFRLHWRRLRRREGVLIETGTS